MAKRWRFHPHDSGYVARLVRELGVTALTAQVLVSRGYRSPEDAAAFLNPRLSDLHDPNDLPGVADATERILRAVESGRRITIYGDYDVDGVAGTSLLWRCLKLLGAAVDYYIPHRLSEGYGLNAEALRTLHAEDPQRLVVTVDCGITAIEEAEVARELGLELIVTDHPLTLLRCLKGPCAGVVALRTLGGEVGGRGMIVEGAARPLPHRRVVAFGRRRGSVASPVGMAQGLFVAVGDRLQRDTRGLLLLGDGGRIAPGRRQRFRRAALLAAVRRAIRPR